MKSDEIIVIGVKSSVIAFQRQSGRRLWAADLGSGFMSQSFVSVIADTARVYAHCRGELYCLDLFTGAQLWKDALTGCGYGMATLAIPGLGSTPSVYAAKQQTDQSDSGSTASS